MFDSFLSFSWYSVLGLWMCVTNPRFSFKFENFAGFVVVIVGLSYSTVDGYVCSRQRKRVSSQSWIVSFVTAFIVLLLFVWLFCCRIDTFGVIKFVECVPTWIQNFCVYGFFCVYESLFLFFSTFIYVVCFLLLLLLGLGVFGEQARAIIDVVVVILCF